MFHNKIPLDICILQPCAQRIYKHAKEHGQFFTLVVYQDVVYRVRGHFFPKHSISL